MNFLNVPWKLMLVGTLKITVVTFVCDAFVLCFHVQPHISSLFCTIVTVVTKMSLSSVVGGCVFAKGGIVNAFKSTLTT